MDLYVADIIIALIIFFVAYAIGYVVGTNKMYYLHRKVIEQMKINRDHKSTPQ